MMSPRSPSSRSVASAFSEILVAARHDPLAGRLDAVDERQRRGTGEVRQRWRRLMSEAVGGIFGMADDDLLEILHAPEVSILADRAEVEARHAKCLGADLGVPAVEAPEVEIRRSVRQTAGLDRVQVIDEEEKDVAVRSIERRRVLGDVDARIVDAGRPVEHARHLPAGVARAVAGDALHGFDQFCVEYPPIIRAGDGAQFHAAVVGFQRLDLLGAIGCQAILQVDPGERGRELP